jgi:ABC-2 type transport system permease protein
MYPVSMVTAALPSLGKYTLLSPPAQIIQDARAAIVNPAYDTVWTFFPDSPLMFVPLLIVVVFVLLSTWYFRKSSRKFAEEI